MRTGKISQAVFERSVFRPLLKTGALAGGFRYGIDCIEEPDGTVRSAASGTVGGFCIRAEMVLDEAVSKLGFCRDITLQVTLMLPEEMEENGLKELVVRLGQEAGRVGAVIGNLGVSVSGQVEVPLLNIAASAKRAEAPAFAASPAFPDAGPEGDRNTCMEACGSAAGPDLVMAGTCGAAGTTILAEDFHEKLSGHFPAAFLREAENVGKNLLTGCNLMQQLNEDHSRQLQIYAFKAVAGGGVFAALWEMCEALDVGLEADIHKIPIRQETVEICECLNRNPYRLYGTGAMLLAVEDGEETAFLLREKGIPAGRIGKLTEGKGRYIHNRDITRCLEKPLPDALILEG